MKKGPVNGDFLRANGRPSDVALGRGDAGVALSTAGDLVAGLQLGELLLMLGLGGGELLLLRLLGDHPIAGLLLRGGDIRADLLLAGRHVHGLPRLGQGFVGRRVQEPVGHDVAATCVLEAGLADLLASLLLHRGFGDQVALFGLGGLLGGAGAASFPLETRASLGSGGLVGFARAGTQQGGHGDGGKGQQFLQRAVHVDPPQKGYRLSGLEAHNVPHKPNARRLLYYTPKHKFVKCFDVNKKHPVWMLFVVPSN